MMSATKTTLRLPPTFNRLAWSNLAAQSAEQIALAAAPIVAVLSLGVGEGQTGLLQTALTLPFILFAIPAGLLADRISRRRLMAGAEALRAAALLGILMLIWLGLLTLPLLALSALSRSAAPSPIAWPRPRWCRRWYRLTCCPRPMRGLNSRAPLPSPADRRSAACWWDGSVLRPPSVSPRRFPSWRWCCCRVSMNPPDSRRRAVIRCRKSGKARPSYCIIRCCGRSSSPSSSSTRASFLLLAVFVPYAVRRLGLSASGVGATLAMYGVGMVAGALAATRVMRRLPFGIVIGLGPVTGFVAAGVMALTTLIPAAPLAGLSFFLLGAGPILWVISTTTLRQSVTPPRLLGRVSAINIMSYGARPLGSALGAVVGGIFGAEVCLYLAVAIFGAQALVILMSPAVSLARQPEMISEPAKA